MLGPQVLGVGDLNIVEYHNGQCTEKEGRFYLKLRESNLLKLIYCVSVPSFVFR